MDQPPPITSPAPVQPKNSGLAISSLVLGILSLVCLSILAGIPAVICGHKAISKINRSGGALEGRGLAIAGLITGYLSIAMIPLMLIMAAIAVPNFVKARNTAQVHACISNLRLIDGAKQQWALENKKQDTDTPDENDLAQYLKRGQFPRCPTGGSYTINAVGEKPTCSAPGHVLDN